MTMEEEEIIKEVVCNRLMNILNSIYSNKINTKHCFFMANFVSSNL